jgi:hypothetical protein
MIVRLSVVRRMGPPAKVQLDLAFPPGYRTRCGNAKGNLKRYNFDWSPDKARRNRLKHGVSFEQGAGVFLDPRALSLYDQEHSETEDRWITLGISATGTLLVVHHTFEEIDESTVTIRIVSCRKATKKEISHYGA